MMVMLVAYEHFRITPPPNTRVTQLQTNVEPSIVVSDKGRLN